MVKHRNAFLNTNKKIDNNGIAHNLLFAMRDEYDRTGKCETAKYFHISHITGNPDGERIREKVVKIVDQLKAINKKRPWNDSRHMDDDCDDDNDGDDDLDDDGDDDVQDHSDYNDDDDDYDDNDDDINGVALRSNKRTYDAGHANIRSRDSVDVDSPNPYSINKLRREAEARASRNAAKLHKTNGGNRSTTSGYTAKRGRQANTECSRQTKRNRQTNAKQYDDDDDEDLNKNEVEGDVQHGHRTNAQPNSSTSLVMGRFNDLRSDWAKEQALK